MTDIEGGMTDILYQIGAAIPMRKCNPDDVNRLLRGAEAEIKRLRDLAYHDKGHTKTWKRSFEITNAELAKLIVEIERLKQQIEARDFLLEERRIKIEQLSQCRDLPEE